jgi:hypothetical protein
MEVLTGEEGVKKSADLDRSWKSARGARDIAKRAMETIGQIFRYAIPHS